MDNWILVLAGLALAVALTSRLRQVDEPARRFMREPWGGRLAGPAERLAVEGAGMFTIKVIALEFDEIGPVMYVNGEFVNGPERLDVDFTAADVTVGGEIYEFVPFDPTGPEGESAGERMGDLHTLSSPLWIEPEQRGKFRAPLAETEREGRLVEVMDRLDDAARRMVDRLDAELGEYALDDESFSRYEEMFVNDHVVRQIAAEIEREFIWKPGRVTAAVRFYNSYEEPLQDAVARFEVTPEDSLTLKKNIRGVVLNALRAELGLDMRAYNAVVFER